MIPGAELALWLALAGCGRSPAPADQPAPQSRPVSAPTRSATPGAVVGLADSPVPQPVTLAELVLSQPGVRVVLDAGPGGVPARVLEGVLNLEPAPCQPCVDGDLSLARCALAPPPGCENLVELVDRAARVAQAGGSPRAVQAVITYGEPWTPVPGAGSPGWPDPAAPVQVELWIDPSWGLWRQAVERAGELVALGQTDPRVGPMAVQIRLFPSWTQSEGASAPVGALAMHRALAAADLLGRGLPYAQALAARPVDAGPMDAAGMEALAVQIGLDPQAWRAALAEQAPARLVRDQEAAAAIGLRASPSWRVDGYRLRGHRSLASLRDVVENQQLDHLAALPAELLAPWDPSRAASAPPALSPPPSP